MTINHSITPSEEMIEIWKDIANNAWNPLTCLAIQAAEWGADQELEACCSIALTALVCGTKQQRRNLVSQIREMRRPKTLQERALSVIDNAVITKQLSVGAAAIVRQALNANN
jgi:hypothetical protein